MIFRFWETKVTMEQSYVAKKPQKISDVNVDNIDISNLVKGKN